MFVYTFDGTKITSCGNADNMSGNQIAAMKKNGFLFTDRNIINDLQGHFYFEDELPEDDKIEINAFILQHAKEVKIDEMKDIRSTKEKEPITTDKGTFDVDTVSIERIRNAIIFGENINWTTADNTSVVMTTADLTNIIKAYSIRSNEIHEIYLTKKEEINNCTSEEELENIQWD